MGGREVGVPRWAFRNRLLPDSLPVLSETQHKLLAEALASQTLLGPLELVRGFGLQEDGLSQWKGHCCT